jgi:hypothetical protein
MQSMFIAEHTAEGGWTEGGMQPYGPISLLPSAQVLNYGQAIFEGMKAQRTEKGSIVLFRPTANAERMRNGAARMSMQPPDEALFVKVLPRFRCATVACAMCLHVLCLHEGAVHSEGWHHALPADCKRRAHAERRGVHVNVAA